MVDVKYPIHFALIKHQGIGYQQSFIIREGVDPIRRNAARRHVMTFDGSHRDFMPLLNKGLRGGESYPYLTGMLSIVAGVVSSGAGIMFTLGTAALDGMRTTQEVQARVGDQIWQVEFLGKEGSDIKHVEYFVLLDPFRKNAANTPVEWIIQETVREVAV